MYIIMVLLITITMIITGKVKQITKATKIIKIIIPKTVSKQ